MNLSQTPLDRLEGLTDDPQIGPWAVAELYWRTRTRDASRAHDLAKHLPADAAAIRWTADLLRRAMLHLPEASPTEPPAGVSTTWRLRGRWMAVRHSHLANPAPQHREELLAVLDEATATERWLNWEDLAHLHNEIGRVCYRLHQTDDALDWFNRAARLHTKSGSIEGAATAVINAGNIYSDKGDAPTALQMYLHAVGLVRPLAAKVPLLQAFSNLVIVTSRWGDLSAARHYMARLDALQDDTASPMQVGNACCALADALSQAGHHDEAWKMLQRGERLLTSADLPTLSRVTHLLAALLAGRQGQTDEVRLHLRRYSAIPGEPDPTLTYVECMLHGMTALHAGDPEACVTALQDQPDHVFHPVLHRTWFEGQGYLVTALERSGQSGRAIQVASNMAAQARTLSDRVLSARMASLIQRFDADKRTGGMPDLERDLDDDLRMASLGRMAAGVAHDLNNTLSVIMGHAELLESGEQSPSLAAIQRAADRAARLTRQLQAVGQQAATSPVPVDVARLIGDVVASHRQVTDPSIALLVEVDQNLPLVRADTSHLERILENLIVNARDALIGGGTVKVLADVEPRGVRIQVEDDGPGIPDTVLPHIFEAFYSTKGKQGSGLGLATVYGLVKQLHGTIEVSTHPDRGTAFSVVLPLSTAA